MKDNGYTIYCVADNDIYKIGYINNAMQRLSMLQIGNPRELKYVFRYPVENIILAKKIEKVCHTKYRKYNVRGEWFTNIDPNYVLKYIISIHKELLKYNSYITHGRFNLTETEDDIIFSMKFLIDVMKISTLRDSKLISEYLIGYNIVDWDEQSVKACLDTINFMKKLENWSY